MRSTASQKNGAESFTSYWKKWWFCGLWSQKDSFAFSSTFIPSQEMMCLSCQFQCGEYWAQIQFDRTKDLNLDFIRSEKVSMEYERSDWIYSGIHSTKPTDGVSNVQCCLHFIHWIWSIPVHNDIDWRSENENRCYQWMWQKPSIGTWCIGESHRIHSTALGYETVKQQSSCSADFSRFHLSLLLSDWSTIFKKSFDQYLWITFYGRSEQSVAFSLSSSWW